MVEGGLQGMLERRQAPRFRLDRRVSVHLSRWSSLQALGHDISEGGIRLSLPCDVVTGDKVLVGLTLPNDLQLSLEAEVRFVKIGTRRGECIAGLMWLEKSSDDVEMLNQMIADLQPASV